MKKLYALILMFFGLTLNSNIAYAITATFNYTNPTCFASANGIVTITVTNSGLATKLNYIIYDKPPLDPTRIVLRSYGPVDITENIHSFSDMTDGTYYIYVLDQVFIDNDFDIYTFTSPTALSLTATGTNPCGVAVDGSITATGDGGTGTMDYTLKDNLGIVQTTSGAKGVPVTFSGLAANTYSVEVTDDNNCGPVSQTGIVILAPLSATVLPPTHVTGCYGNSNGAITITSPTGGSGEYEYTINGGGNWNNTTGSFTNLTAGTYNVQMRDKNTPSCVKVLNAALVINQPPQHTVTSINVVQIPCPESLNVGSITFVGTAGGTAPYFWSIDNGAHWQTSNTFNNLAPNQYHLKICNRFNTSCVTDFGLVNISRPLPLSFTTLTPTPITCNGDHNGIITALATGGTKPYTYTLNPGGITQNPGDGIPASFPGLYPGTYTVTVKDNVPACAILVSGDIVISEPAVLSVTVTPSPASACQNVGLQLTANPVGGNGGYTYAWTAPDGGSFDNAAIQAPLYTHNVVGGPFRANVSVSDSKSCPAVSGSTNITVNPNNTITLTSAAGTNAQTPCIGVAITNITYATTGATGATVTGLPAGVTGSWAGDVVTISGAPTVSGPFSYTVTLTGGCGVVTAAGTINIYIAPNNTYTVSDPTVCYYEDAIVNVSSSELGVTYVLRDNADIMVAGPVVGTGVPISFTLLANTLTVGSFNYNVLATNGFGCSTVLTDLAVITKGAEVTFTYTSNDVTCNGLSTGIINVTAANGTAPYSVAIDGINFLYNTGVDILVPAGSYSVIVKDFNNCLSAIQTVDIDEPLALTATVDHKDIECYGNADGEIDITAIGGTAPYKYSINNGVDFFDEHIFSLLTAGLYDIVVRDFNNCTFTTSVTIDDLTVNPLDNIIITENTCYGGSTGAIQMVPNLIDYTGPFQYSLDGVNFTTDDKFTGLIKGIYTVYYKTGAGTCIYTEIIPVGEPPEISVTSLNHTDLDCGGAANGTITITAVSFNTVGDPLAVEYSIDGFLYISPGIFNGLSGGDYTVYIRDENLCIKEVTVSLTEPSAIVFTNQLKTDITCNGVPPDGTITLQVSGGEAPYSYSITGGAPFPSSDGIFTGLTAGNYTAAVQDNTGCIKIGDSFTIIEPSAITITAQSYVDFTCFNGTATFSVDATGGTDPLVYNLYDDTHTQVLTNADGEFTINQSGTYTVEVTDINSCASPPPIGPYTFTKPADIIIDNQSFTQMTAVVADDGTITVLASGGTGALHYTLNTLNPLNPLAGTVLTPGAGLPALFENLSADTYTVVISDDKGCAISADPVQIGLLELILSPTQITCEGKNDGQIVLTINNGTAPFTITWTGPSGSLPAFDGMTSLTGLVPGLYTVQVIDAIGLIGTSSTLLIELSPIVVAFDIPAEPLKCSNIPEGNVYLHISGGIPDYTFQWSNGQTTQNLEGVTSGDYTVTITDAVGCTTTKTATISALSEMLRITDTTIVPARCYQKMEAFNDKDIGSIKINAHTGGAEPITYLWDHNSVEGDFIDELKWGNYTLTTTDANGCIYHDTIFVPYDSTYYMLADAYQDTTICYGTSVDLVVKTNAFEKFSIATYTYEWYKVPETATGKPLSRNSVFTTKPNVDTTLYYLEIRNDGGCISTDYVTVARYPKIGIYVPPYISAVRDSIISILAGTTYNIDVNTYNTEYETTFKWEPEFLFSPNDSWNSEVYFTDPNLIPEEYWVELTDPVTNRKSNYIKITATATTSKGCLDSLALYAKLVDKLSFGNVFSPNGDGINDVWQVPKDYLFPDLEIEVFNRWGSLVWSARGSKAAQGWNGKTNNGNDLPIGTYYYVIKYNVHTNDGKWKPINGSVTIVR